MKRWLFFLLILGCCAELSTLTAAATAEGEGAKKLRSGNDQLTMLLLLSEHRKNFAVNDFAQGREVLQKKMTASPGQYQHTAAARNALRGDFEQALRDAYEKETAKMLNAVYSEGIPMDAVSTVKRDEAAFLKQRSRSLYERIFQEVRSKLAERQKMDFFQQIHPTAAELEEYDDAALAKILVRRYRTQNKFSLWEENLALLQKEPQLPAIANGREQQKFQLKLARSFPVPARMWKAEETEAFLASAIQEAARQRFSGAFCYPLFEKTRQSVHQRAKDLPLERAVAALPHHLDPAPYRTLLEKEAAQHRVWSESFKLAQVLYAAQLKQQSLERCAPPEEVKKTLENDPIFEKAALTRVDALKTELLAVRQKLAQQQLEKAWPELVAKEWQPQPNEVETFAASGSRELPPLQGQPDGAAWLEETHREMTRLLREALTREVARLETQRRTVEELYDEVLNRMTARSDAAREREESWFGKVFSGKTAVDLKEVIQYYTAETEKRASSPLFPSIEREIEVRSRAILQQLKKMAPAKKESPDPKKPKKKMILTLKLSEKNGTLHLSCGSWKTSFTDGQLPKAALKAELERRFAEDKEVDAWQIRLIVNRDRIYYSTVSELRTFLKESINGATVEDSLLKP